MFQSYRLHITQQLRIIFQSKEVFDKKFFITTFPIMWESQEQVYLLGQNAFDQFLQIEICMKLLFSVKESFQVSWYSKSQVKGLVIKTFIANLPDTLLNPIIKPIGKIKDKNNEKKDSFTCIIQLTNLKPNGNFTASINYQFQPQSWLLSKQWGKKSDFDRKMIQKYSQEQKFWRFPSEFEKLISPLEQIDDVFKIAQEIYTLAQKTIVAESLTYRKGVLNLIHDMRGDCDEFTDLTVVLLHRLAIPVKRVTGMTYDFISKKIIHHAWPEIFVPKYNKWVPIDSAMNYFGFQSLSVIPLKIEGSTVIPNQFEVSLVDPTQKIDVKIQLLETEINYVLS